MINTNPAVLVTGANGGLGRALVEEAPRSGAARVSASMAESRNDGGARALERQHVALVQTGSSTP